MNKQVTPKVQIQRKTDKKQELLLLTYVPRFFLPYLIEVFS